MAGGRGRSQSLTLSVAFWSRCRGLAELERDLSAPCVGRVWGSFAEYTLILVG